MIYSWQRILGIAYTSDALSPYVRDKTIKKIDDHTLRITMAKPGPMLPNEMTEILVVPKANAGLKASDYDSGKAAGGTGPFRFVEFARGDHLTLAANPDWWNDKVA